MRKYSHSFSVVEAHGNDKEIFVEDLIRQGISDGCAVILASDSDPGETREKLERKGLDVNFFVGQARLTILDKEFVYSIAQTGLKADLVIKKWLSLVSEIKERSGCQCILAVGTAKVFFDSKNPEKLMAYEDTIGRNFEGIPLEAVCCYEADSFSKLPLKEIIHILNYHEFTIYQGGVYLQWQPRMILALLERAIDNALGIGTSKLLIKTLELIYHVDGDGIVLQPQLFQEKLERILGPSSDIAISKIKARIITELMYLRKIDGINWGNER